MPPTPPRSRCRTSRSWADLSDQWLVEVAVGDDGDEGCFGPLTARAAWDLAVGVDHRRPDWNVSILPLYLPGTPDELAAAFDDDDEETAQA